MLICRVYIYTYIYYVVSHDVMSSRAMLRAFDYAVLRSVQLGSAMTCYVML